MAREYSSVPTAVDAFARGDVADREVQALLRGAALLSARGFEAVAKAMRKNGASAPVPAAVGLLALLVTPPRWLATLGVLAQDTDLRVPRRLPVLLAAGRLDAAVDLAWRTLRGAGLAPALPRQQLPSTPGVPARRLGAALLLPLQYRTSAWLAHLLLHDDEAGGARPAAANT